MSIMRWRASCVTVLLALCSGSAIGRTIDEVADGAKRSLNALSPDVVNDSPFLTEKDVPPVRTGDKSPFEVDASKDGQLDTPFEIDPKEDMWPKEPTHRGPLAASDLQDAKTNEMPFVIDKADAAAPAVETTAKPPAKAGPADLPFVMETPSSVPAAPVAKASSSPFVMETEVEAKVVQSSEPQVEQKGTDAVVDAAGGKVKSQGTMTIVKNADPHPWKGQEAAPAGPTTTHMVFRMATQSNVQPATTTAAPLASNGLQFELGDDTDGPDDALLELVPDLKYVPVRNTPFECEREVAQKLHTMRNDKKKQSRRPTVVEMTRHQVGIGGDSDSLLEAGRKKSRYGKRPSIPKRLMRNEHD